MCAVAQKFRMCPVSEKIIFPYRNAASDFPLFMSLYSNDVMLDAEIAIIW